MFLDKIEAICDCGAKIPFSRDEIEKKVVCEKCHKNMLIFEFCTKMATNANSV